jgi:hypothetical protein
MVQQSNGRHQESMKELEKIMTKQNILEAFHTLIYIKQKEL